MGARRMLCFTAEQVFLPMKEVSLMPNCKIHSAQQRGGKKPKGREKIYICILFGLAIDCEFYCMKLMPIFYFCVVAAVTTTTFPIFPLPLSILLHFSPEISSNMFQTVFIFLKFRLF